MKKFLIALSAAAAVSAAPAFAHHPAADIVDDEIYEMIDSMVMDTPHADLTFEDDMGGSTDITLTTTTVSAMENMIDDGLLDAAAMLDGDVDVNISFTDTGGVSLTIEQRPSV